ncbi:hypothetical protein G6F40_017063 [Rhizopus arrhizus]|nr:hypothetical protein G6F40_017063 [Rhizopus arrhizus]
MGGGCESLVGKSAQYGKAAEQPEPQQQQDRQGHGRSHRPPARLARRAIRPRQVAGRAAAIDLGSVDDRHHAQRQAAEQRRQDRPDQMVGDVDRTAERWWLIQSETPFLGGRP